MDEFTEEEIQAEADRIHMQECGCHLNATHHYGWRNLARLSLEGQKEKEQEDAVRES